MAAWKAFASWSRGVISLKRMPRCGKSGMSRIQSSRRISGADDIDYVLLYLQIGDDIVNTHDAVCSIPQHLTGRKDFREQFGMEKATARSPFPYRIALILIYGLHLRGAIRAARRLLVNDAQAVGTFTRVQDRGGFGLIAVHECGYR